ncbi:P-loop containing nucleoside triphosphate hydrolase protein, partial [Hyaloraphidium curvatum]
MRSTSVESKQPTCTFPPAISPMASKRGPKELLLVDDFVRTIEDDEDVQADDEEEEPAENDSIKAKKGEPSGLKQQKSKTQLRKEKRLAKKAAGPEGKPAQPVAAAKDRRTEVPAVVELNPDFQFDIDGSFSASRYANAWDFTSAKAAIAKQQHSAFTSVDDKIRRAQQEADNGRKRASKAKAPKADRSSAGTLRAMNGKAEPGESEDSDASGASADGDEFMDASEGSDTDMLGNGPEDANSNSDEDSNAASDTGSATDEPPEDDAARSGDEVNNDFGSDGESEGQSEDVEAHPMRPGGGGGNAGNSDTDDDVAQDIISDRKKAQFFEVPDLQPQDPAAKDEGMAFTDLNLSRPIMRSIAALGYTAPTQIQQHAIPMAMLGKDICGSAVTGSGKTAAFVIPILERLLFRPKNPPLTRVLILVPTRELGIQCHSVASNLAKFTDVKCALCVGGLSTKAQEMELRKRPDIVIATPGRLIDHVRNSVDFTLESIEIVVIDEADRILEDGFKDELAEIISFTPKTRQTMLFSATMTDSVDDLVRLSLNRPVRLFVNSNRNLASGLVQEFIRIRSSKDEADKQAILASLVMRTYKAETIIFFGSKAAAHQMKIVFGLLGLKAAELHGDLSQLQRLEALEQFRDRQVDFLLATDLASRGLDIAGIQTVINFDMPKTYQQYVHRVGRTARAKTNGRSVSLVTEADRKILKQALKNTHEAVKNRIIPPAVVQKYKAKIEGFRPHLKKILEEEKEEKALARAEMEATKAENMIMHADEIASRPARTWFQSEQQKKQAKNTSRPAGTEEDGVAVAGQKRRLDSKDAPKRGKLDGLTRRKKRRLQAMKEMADEGLKKDAKLAARAAKSQLKPRKLSAFADPSERPKHAATKAKKKNGGAKKEVAGDRDKSRTKAKGSPKGKGPGLGKGSGFKSKAKFKR